MAVSLAESLVQDWDDIADVGQMLVRAAQTQPTHGVRYLTSEVTTDAVDLPYPELLAESLRIVSQLQACGTKPGRVVALLLERPEEFLPAFWACLLGGFVACPLVPVRGDVRRWAAQLTLLDSLLDGPLVLTTSDLRAEMPVLDGLTVVDLAKSTAVDTAVLEGATVHRPQPEDLALLVLTSGSTGNAKAVKLTHANLLASMRAKVAMLGATAADVTLNWVSYDHVAAVLEEHMLPTMLGATQLHTTSDVILADPMRFLRIIDAHRVTMTFAPNFVLGLINKELVRDPNIRRMDLSCLRRIVSGGEASPVATGLAFLELLAPHGLARTALWPAFGMTETCAGSIYNWSFPEADMDAEFAAVGSPVDGLQIRVVDAADRVLPDGQSGDVQLRGAMVTTGYYNNVQATQAAFTADGWFRTGDLGVLTAGRLTLVGRSKDSIIVNGVNYYSHDLESVLTELDGIERSFVAAFPIRSKGKDTEELAVAFATTVQDADETALHRLLIAVRNRVVMHWGFRPAVLLPLPRAAFPKTSLGKIQRALMRQRVEAGEYLDRQEAVSALFTRQCGGHEVPNGQTELALVEIYAEMFAVSPDRISTTASFFDLGGTSLDILRLKRLVSARLGASLPVRSVLRAPSVRELARVLDAPVTAPDEYDPVIALQTSGKKTPLFCVHPGVGEVLVFVNLAKYFVHERPFYALRARGFNQGEQPFTSFAEMTKTYTEAIRKVQPHGPYAIAGYSFGAAVAFEIAKLLEADGERVDFLGSFNLPPHIKYRMDELDYVETAVNLAMFLDLVSKEQASALPADLRQLPGPQQLAALLALAPPDRLAELDLDLPRFTAWVDLADGLTNLGATYQPSGTVRSMSVFCADPLRGTRHDWINNELRRWDEHSQEPVRYIDVPGEHYTLMGPAHVDAFQAILRAELYRALGGA